MISGKQFIWGIVRLPTLGSACLNAMFYTGFFWALDPILGAVLGVTMFIADMFKPEMLRMRSLLARFGGVILVMASLIAASSILVNLRGGMAGNVEDAAGQLLRVDAELEQLAFRISTAQSAVAAQQAVIERPENCGSAERAARVGPMCREQRDVVMPPLREELMAAIQAAELRRPILEERREELATVALKEDGLVKIVTVLLEAHAPDLQPREWWAVVILMVCMVVGIELAAVYVPRCGPNLRFWDDDEPQLYSAHGPPPAGVDDLASRDEQMVAMWRGGMTQAAIGSVFGVGQPAVHKRLKTLGILEKKPKRRIGGK